MNFSNLRILREINPIGAAILSSMAAVFIACGEGKKNSDKPIELSPDSVWVKFGYNRSFYPSCSVIVIATKSSLIWEAFPKNQTINSTPQSKQVINDILVKAEKIIADSQASIQFRREIEHIKMLKESGDHGGGFDGMTTYSYICDAFACDSIWKWQPKKFDDPKEIAAALLGANLIFKTSRIQSNKRYFWGILITLDARLFDSIPEPR